MGPHYAPAEDVCAAISLVDRGGGDSGFAFTAGDAGADAGEHGVGQVDVPGAGERPTEWDDRGQGMGFELVGR